MKFGFDAHDPKLVKAAIKIQKAFREWLATTELVGLGQGFRLTLVIAAVGLMFIKLLYCIALIFYCIFLL